MAMIDLLMIGLAPTLGLNSRGRVPA